MKKVKCIVMKILRNAWESVCNNRGEILIPHEVIEKFASHFLPKIQAYFENPENQKAFERWQKEKESANKPDKIA